MIIVRIFLKSFWESVPPFSKSAEKAENVENVSQVSENTFPPFSLFVLDFPPFST